MKSSNRRNWTVPSTEDIDEFFGYSGSLWTPKKWKALKNSGVRAS